MRQISKLIYIVGFLVLPLHMMADEIVIDDINVTSNGVDVDSDSTNDEVFQDETYMKSAPMQKQISIKEALQIAGTNGDPVKALKAFAGVVSTNNDDSSEIYIHGSKPRETKFSIDHLPVGYLFHLGGLHSVIAPEMTDQIDAYLGGFDVTYGAMGAIVDITPKYPTGSGKGRVHVGLYDADFAYDMRLSENTKLFIGARRSYLDLIADKIMDEFDSDDEDSRKKTTFTLAPQFNDAQLILTHQIENEIFSLEMLTAHDRLKINDTFNIEKDPVAVGKINVDVESNTVGLRWIHMGDNTTSNTLLYRLYVKNNSEFYDADYFVDTSLEKYGLYHETTWELKDHTITAGLDLIRLDAPTRVHANRPPISDYEEPVTGQDVIDIDKTFKAKEYTLFAQDMWDITDRNHFRYGLRVWNTDFQNFGSGIDPRVAFVHDFDDDLTVSMSLGQYSQRPSTFMTIDGFGNPKIDTQESAIHYTMSFQKKIDESSSVVIEPYFKKFKNLAIADTLNRFESVGKGQSYGLDLTYKKKIEDLDVMLAYTFVKAKRELTTDNIKQYRFEGDIPHTLQLSTNYHFGENWRVSGYFKYSSGAPYTPIIGTEKYNYNNSEYIRPVYGEPYSKRLPSNYDMDIQIGKTYQYANNKSLEVSLELMNINALFKTNTAGIKYNDQYEEDGTYKQIGFLPALHLNYRF